MTTITINRDVFAQHIQGLIEVMRMPNSEHVADAHNKAVRFLHAALAAQPSNYSDWQQRRGVLADIVDEALASYEAWMAEDDYNATDALHKIMDHMRQRAASYAKPAQQPAPAWHDAPTVPGNWILETLAGGLELFEEITQTEINNETTWPGRWYGPIPPDGDKP